MNCSRRSFFKAAGALALPAVLPRMAFAQSAGAGAGDTLVLVFQRGGMDALNAVVPHADSNYYRLRPNLAIPRPGTGATAALDLDGFFGFHPSLAPLMPLYQSGKLAVVHATGFQNDSRSHFECQDRVERASLNLLDVQDGWLNRHLQAIGVGAAFQGMGIGTTLQGTVRGPAPVIGLSNIAAFALRTSSGRKQAIADAFHGLYDAESALSLSARQALGAVDELALANPAQFPVEGGASYPTTMFGNQMREVAQLIKANLGLRVVCLDIGGWDHHANEATLIAALLDELGRTLAAFDTDLGARMANVSVVTMTEFGRRAAENASAGCDHGLGFAMFLLGGGVVGRTVYRDWPGLADSQLVRGDLGITIDYRTVLAELLERRLGGTDLAHVFPGYTHGPYVGAFLQR